MSNGSIFGLAIRVLLLCFLSVQLTGCIASAATEMAKTTVKATGNAMRTTKRVMTKPFRKDDEAKEQAK